MNPKRRLVSLALMLCLPLTACQGIDPTRPVNVDIDPPPLLHVVGGTVVRSGATETVATSSNNPFSFFRANEIGQLYGLRQYTGRSEEASGVRSSIYHINPESKDHPLETNLIQVPVNSGWRIGTFAASEHFLWWTELQDRRLPNSWRLYERPLAGGRPQLIAEEPKVESLMASAPDGLAANRDRLVFRAGDRRSAGYHIYLRDPAKKDRPPPLTELHHSRRANLLLSPPSISGPYVTWDESRLRSGDLTESTIVLANLDSGARLRFRSRTYALTQPTVSEDHLIVRMLPEGHTYQFDKDGDIIGGAELWHYHIANDRWDFRIALDSPIYNNATRPDTLLEPRTAGHYLTWTTDPRTDHPFLIDMNRRIAFPIPVRPGHTLDTLLLTPNALYWRGNGASDPLFRTTLPLLPQQKED